MSKRYDKKSVLSAANSAYLMAMAEEAENLNQEWADFFKENNTDSESEMRAIQEAFRQIKPNGQYTNRHAQAVSDPVPLKEGMEENLIHSLNAHRLIRAYRVQGHFWAQLDPLGINTCEEKAALTPSSHGLGKTALEQEIYLDGSLGLTRAKLSQILEKLKRTYCGKIGFEFSHILDREQHRWLQHKVEREQYDISDVEKKRIYTDLVKAESFEKFLHVKFPGAKRFGLDGGESLIPLMETTLEFLSRDGADEVVLGMAHRGRLNVLTNVLGQKYRYLLVQFLGQSVHDDSVEASGDVKYHQGYSSDRTYDGKDLHLSLTANPSHLEAVSPVVLGKVKAKQKQRNDKNLDKVVGIIMHGDAAFSGQGLVSETLELSDLDGYKTGGTIHIIINNQIGFTTNPTASRSTPYCSDLAKAIQAPIFHINADCPESVVYATKIAVEFQRRFKKDVIIDLVCYRRHGHNEGDEPTFTQPLMYQKIKKHPTVRKIYEDKLLKNNVASKADLEAIQKEQKALLDKEFKAAQKYGEEDEKLQPDWLEGAWKDVQSGQDGDRYGYKTGVDLKKLTPLAEKLYKVPSHHNIHSKIQRQHEQKNQLLKDGKGFDWAMGEALAFASLLDEGYDVRLSGQDCGRGTFSHRHAVLWDQKERGKKYVPLNNLHDKQGQFEVYDSPLAEASILGFEYGYSIADPKTLVLWEAQFGDFANGAQMMIDQFISASESKWFRLCGLTMLLPHGYEGQGPEHSSARLERFLQLCAEDNMQVMNITTPANFFHALRRQIHSPSRRPLVVMTPKSLLRHKKAVSDFEDFGTHQIFHPVLMDESVDPAKTKRVVLCSGKVYYDLLKEKEERKLEDVALIRLEQLYPFPDIELKRVLTPFKNAKIIWCQEEPHNMGSWHFLDRQLEDVLKRIGLDNPTVDYAGRAAAASPATGQASKHKEEQDLLVKDALGY